MSYASCALCGREYDYGEVMCGVRFPDGYYEGHYDCVVKAMGPERTLEAIQSGQLPTRQVLEQHRVYPRGGVVSA